MTLETLFKKRRTRYLKVLLKYGRIIFNDHFVLLLFILFGAGGYAYSQYLDTFSLGAIQPRLLLALLFLLITSTGSMTLLLEPADQIFLLPKEQSFKKVFKQLVTQSYVESLISVGMVAVITFPVLVTTFNAKTGDLLFVFLALAGLKWLTLLLKLFPFFETDEAVYQRNQWLLFLVKLGTIVGLLFFNIKASALMIAALALVTAYSFYSERLYFNRLFNWEVMIEAEDKRMQKLYRFIGMIANVPNIQTNIKRLAWLDGLLNKLSKRNPTASYYYTLRLVARNPEYSLMIIRATIVGAIVLAVTESIVISAVIVVLFLYIIGFQLLTLANELKRVPLFQIYPITTQEKAEAVYQLIFQFLFVVSFLLAAAAVNGVGLVGLTLAVLGVVFSYLFSYFLCAKTNKCGRLRKRNIESLDVLCFRI